MNPTHRYPLFDGPHSLGADLHLIDWLEEQDFACDVLTDHDLDREGIDILNEYRVLILGTHPEYWTAAMCTALEKFQNIGGRLMYLGGNGLFFVTATDSSGRILEVRRERWTEGVGPGEHYLSLANEYGGCWWNRGMPPNKFLGCGTSSVGFDRGSAYRRCESSFDPRVRFVFEGIEEEMIGDFPTLVLGYGAAGYEIDRVDDLRGTPKHAIVVATSVGFSDAYQVLTDDVNMVTPFLGGTQSNLVRADMVFFETPNGGAVFSVGSISWCSALSYNHHDNSVSRITENVLKAFLSDACFPV